MFRYQDGQAALAGLYEAFVGKEDERNESADAVEPAVDYELRDVVEADLRVRRVREDVGTVPVDLQSGHGLPQYRFRYVDESVQSIEKSRGPLEVSEGDFDGGGTALD